MSHHASRSEQTLSHFHPFSTHFQHGPVGGQWPWNGQAEDAAGSSSEAKEEQRRENPTHPNIQNPINQSIQNPPPLFESGPKRAQGFIQISHRSLHLVH